MRWQPVVLGVVIVAAAVGGGAWWVQANRPKPVPPPEPALPTEEPVELAEATGGTGDTGAHCTADTGLVGEVATTAPTAGPEGAALEPLDRPACADPGLAKRPLELKPAKPADGVALVVVNLAGEATTAPISGATCGKAKDAARCATLVGRPPPLDGITRARDRRSLLVWTAGDEVGWVRTPDELVAFLGPIDTPDEAALVVDAGVEVPAYQVPCLAKGARQTPEGFELFVRSGLCEDEREHRVVVKPDGTVTQRFAALPAQPLQCACGLHTRPPHLEDSFDQARKNEATLAAAAMASNAAADWEAYLEVFPLGPRHARARHALAGELLGRLAGERDALSWDTEIAGSEGDPDLLWAGRKAAVQGVKLDHPALTKDPAGGWTLSVDVVDDGDQPVKEPAIWFDLLAADGRLVDQRLEVGTGEVVPAKSTKTLSWPVDASGVHPDAATAVAWFVAFE